MPVLTNDLTDFLAQLLALRKAGGRQDERMDAAIEAYLDFLNRLGIEHCKIGGFAIDAEAGRTQKTCSAARLSSVLVEEFVGELAQGDPVLRRVETHDPTNPVMRFEIAPPAPGEIEAFHSSSRNAQIERTRAGIEEGIALIGRTSFARARPGSDDGRYFGFVIGGKRGTRSNLATRGPQVEIAAVALLDQILPRIEAMIDDYEDSISVRERDVLVAAARGAMRKQIAFEFKIALPTVDMHISAIKRKLRAATLAEAVAKASRYGLL